METGVLWGNDARQMRVLLRLVFCPVVEHSPSERPSTVGRVVASESWVKVDCLPGCLSLPVRDDVATYG